MTPSPARAAAFCRSGPPRARSSLEAHPPIHLPPADPSRRSPFAMGLILTGFMMAAMAEVSRGHGGAGQRMGQARAAAASGSRRSRRARTGKRSSRRRRRRRKLGQYAGRRLARSSAVDRCVRAASALRASPRPRPWERACRRIDACAAPQALALLAGVLLFFYRTLRRRWAPRGDESPTTRRQHASGAWGASGRGSQNWTHTASCSIATHCRGPPPRRTATCSAAIWSPCAPRRWRSTSTRPMCVPPDRAMRRGSA